MRRLLVVLLTLSILFVQAASVAIVVGQCDAEERNGRQQTSTASGVQIALGSSGDLPAPEFTGSLDPQNRDHVIALFREFRGQNTAVIVVTHDPVMASAATRL